jgi:YebC/PmpR family DNA-binding regulatory protein
MSGHSKWATIKHKKSKTDAQRGKVFTKVSRDITVAVRQGGGSDPTGNMRLKLALQKAKEANLPNDNIQRAIQKGLGGADGVNYEELTYEGYGPGGAAVMVEAMTDNRNRTAGEIRHLFSKFGGNMGETGCVGWMFDKKGLFVIAKEDIQMDEEALMSIALEAGADDFKVEDDSYEIITNPKDFEAVQSAMQAANIKTSVAQISLVPQNTVVLQGDDAVKMLKLMEILEEHDDVQEVYANFDIDEDLMV